MSGVSPVTAPYKGLVPYDEDDALFFFGREREREIIAANLRAARLTVLYGPSGVGKSSVLRAGVQSHLRWTSKEIPSERGIPAFIVIVFDSWRDDPIPSLLKQVETAVSEALGEEVAEGVPVSRSLGPALQVSSERLGGELLIILDQFEEYFLYHPQDVDKREGSFDVEFPRAINQPNLGANFLISIREDALAKLDRFKGRIPNLFGNYLRIEHLGAIAARAAIEGPLEQYNHLCAGSGSVMSIEPALVEAVLNQVRAGQVGLGDTGRATTTIETESGQVEAPYLQLVMLRLWEEERRADSTRLRLETLNRLGGAERIVRTHLNTAMASLSPREREVAARVFHHLVTPSGTKIAFSESDLSAYAGLSTPELIPVLEKLAAPDVRILRPVPPSPEKPGDLRYEIFHDVLAAGVLEVWRQYSERQAQEAVRRDRRAARVRLATRIAIGVALTFLLALGIWAGLAVHNGLHITGDWVDLNGPLGGTIIPLGVDPKNAQIAYAHTRGRDQGLFKTTDAGRTWIAINTGLPGSDILGLAINPNDTHILYVNTQGGGVFKSTDAGASWVPSNAGLWNYNIRRLLIDPRDPNVIFAAASGLGGGVYHSTDGASSWVREGTGLESEYVHDLIPDPLTPDTFYVLTDFGVFQTTDLGKTYEIADYQFPAQVVESLWLTSDSAETRYVIGRGGKLYRNDIVEDDWRALRLESRNDRALFVVPDLGSPGTLFASVRSALGGYSLLKSADRGESWVHVDSNLPKAPIVDLDYDEPLGQQIYLGTDTGLFKSDNLGVSWQPVEVGESRASVASIAVAPDDPNRLWAGMYGGVAMSRDAGKSWSLANDGLRSAEVRTIAVNPTDSQDLFTGVYRAGLPESIYRSQNGGLTWVASAQGIDNDDTVALLFRQGDPWVLYAGTFGGGVYRTVDGVRWTAVNDGLIRRDISALAGDPGSSDSLYAATGGGVFRTVDGGASWVSINEGLGDLDVQALATDPQRSGLIYAATRSGGIYVSINGGESWLASNRGLARLNVIALAADPRHPGTVYAATDTGGVYRSIDEGRKWTPLSRGMMSSNVKTLTVPSLGPEVVYAGTIDTGVLRYEPRFVWEKSRGGP